MTEPRLWADVPVGERVTIELLEEFAGTNEQHLMLPEWLRHREYKLLRQDGCGMAVKWTGIHAERGLWYKCLRESTAGQAFCWQHGGHRRWDSRASLRERGWRWRIAVALRVLMTGNIRGIRKLNGIAGGKKEKP
jgi:hypothetical protein